MGKKVDLDKMRSVGTLRSGYKNATRTYIKDQRGSKQVEHFDGRVDTEIRPKAVRIGTTIKETD